MVVVTPRINRLVNDSTFMNWWMSGDAPQIVTVFLDGEGPFGDCYQLDSENSGPYGNALVEELIPGVEGQYRAIGTTGSRFVDGCSTGGWVSLALQVFYPEVFQGCWSYSPDPVSFEKMQLVNIYADENAFVNDKGYLRPSMRNIYGEPQFSIQQEIFHENIQGPSNSYVTSGQQWGAWNALYSPKGTDGLPMAIFDPVTGVVNNEVARAWEQYDLLKHLKENWTSLGPKLQGKINIWMGDMDEFYLNNAVRDLDSFLKSTSSPPADAKIEFTPMMGHCDMYDHKNILEAIWQSLKYRK